MPTPGSPDAPITFTGADDRLLVDFFKQLEARFDDAGVVTDAEKVDYLPRYVSVDLQEWFSKRPGVVAKNYKRAKEEILLAFGSPQDHPRYTKSDLMALTTQQEQTPLADRNDLNKRTVQFENIADDLLKDGKMTKKELDRAYFLSFPKEL
jgi:hypothetical protein